MGDGLLSLNWNNHGATFCHTLASLRGKDKYTDVTISCDGKFYQVHKLVLSTCSEYFEKIFENTPCKHPVIVLRDVNCEELESLLNYMYKGVVSVAQSHLSRLIKVAELLEIKGLAVPDEPPVTSKSSNKRSNDNSDDRLSPIRTSDDWHSSQSNVDKYSSISPSPKRRRRKGSDNHPPRSSVRSEELPHSLEGRNCRSLDNSMSPDQITGSILIDVEETQIKEEAPDVPESKDMMDGLGEGVELDPPASTAPAEVSQNVPMGLMIPKFDDHKDESQGTATSTLSDPLVEALAGPSGVQGWADEGDVARRGGLPLPEGFSGNEGHNMSSSVGPSSEGSAASAEGSGGQQPQQMVQSFLLKSRKKHACPYCPYSSDKKNNLEIHIRSHTGERPFACQHCSYRSSHRSNLKMHELTHKFGKGVIKGLYNTIS